MLEPILRQLNPFYITVTYSVRLEVLTEVTMKVTVFWDVIPPITSSHFQYPHA
jgi:hypothetical protein